MQRAYALRKTSGELIFLFEERALATGFETSVFTELVAELLERAQIPLHELGAVESKGALQLGPATATRAGLTPVPSGRRNGCVGDDADRSAHRVPVRVWPRLKAAKRRARERVGVVKEETREMPGPGTVTCTCS